MARELFGTGKILIGVIHLLPLPGSPRWNGNLKSVMNRAKMEAGILQDGGAQGVIVENFGDSPFRTGRVDPETVAAMTLAVEHVRGAVSIPVGINMLRNDAISALGVAVATGSEFIRVNVHYGVMATDEGIVEGEAHETTRRRRSLNADVQILADVLVKHAEPMGQKDIGLVAQETTRRALADGLIVSGPATGQPTNSFDVSVVRRAVPDGFVLVGSGINDHNVWRILEHADGAIVGTSLKKEGIVTNPVDPERVSRLAEIFASMP
ncbi:Photosystem I biogenesis protein BtpA [Geodia barretti]|uniref:Photosystem I biogenesis protein BtpA n=2 Tax=Geodia barretti TaxID=519541 RepID=A0AA35SRR2_GEOBA|nr:Photosystem I biogenesis protein BtpA [Geodia barretti]